MKVTSELVRSLNEHFHWNKARMMCFAHMLLGLMAVKTVNLQQLALGFAGEAQVSSRYRRLQRFFAYFEMDLTQVARWIFKLFFADAQKFYILIDRTNWFFGKKKINVFMLSVAYEGLAIPLFWSLLNKGGSSNQQEQKALINRFIKTFGVKGIAGLLADREFGSGELFSWLNKKKIPFYIRIKEGSNVWIKKRKLWKVKKIFKPLGLNQSRHFDMDIELFGAKVFLAGSRSERGELMVVATNQSPKNAIAIYLRRWEIESLFQSLKGRGFQFEATHITHPERLSKLIALLAVGFSWAHKVGEWQAQLKPILRKKFRQSTRPQWSFFRYGLDLIRESILHIDRKANQLKKCIQLIELPYLKEASS